MSCPGIPVYPIIYLLIHLSTYLDFSAVYLYLVVVHFSLVLTHNCNYASIDYVLIDCVVVSVDGLTCHGFIDLLDYVNYYVADITGRYYISF